MLAKYDEEQARNSVEDPSSIKYTEIVLLENYC